MKPLRKPALDACADELPLFLAVDSRLVETPVASNPKSAASEDAGDALSPASRAHQQNAVLVCLGRVPGDGVISRHELSVRTTLDKEVLCWRLAELSPEFVEVVERACLSHKKRNLKVAGFRLTPAGRSRVRAVSP